MSLCFAYEQGTSLDAILEDCWLYGVPADRTVLAAAECGFTITEAEVRAGWIPRDDARSAEIAAMSFDQTEDFLGNAF